jgi:hypothetical protein
MKHGFFVSGGARDLPVVGGPCAHHTSGRVHGILYGFLRAGIQSTPTLVHPVAPVVLWPRAATANPFGGPSYHGIHDPM